jgi:hypothetical protein
MINRIYGLLDDGKILEREGVKKLADQRFARIKADCDLWHHPSRGFV